MLRVNKFLCRAAKFCLRTRSTVQKPAWRAIVPPTMSLTDLLRSRLSDEWGAKSRLARAAQIDAGYLTRILKGEANPTTDVWVRLLVGTGMPEANALQEILASRGVIAASALPQQPRREPLTPPASVAVVEDVDADDLAGRVLGRDLNDLAVDFPPGLLQLKALLGDALTDDEFAYLYGFADPTVRDQGARGAARWDVDEWWKALRHLRECRMLGRDPDLPER